MSSNTAMTPLWAPNFTTGTKWTTPSSVEIRGNQYIFFDFVPSQRREKSLQDLVQAAESLRDAFLSYKEAWK